MGRGKAANEQLANVFAGIVDRVHEIWHDDEDIYPVFPWLKDGTPSKLVLRLRPTRVMGQSRGSSRSCKSR